MAIDAACEVRDLAIRVPGAIKVFEHFGIDYCCRGARPLDEACKEAGVSLDTLIPALRAVSERGAEDHVDWLEKPIGALLAHIVDRHHAYTRETLDALGPMADKVLKRHGAVHPGLLVVRQLVGALDDELRPHMMKEEIVLFPYIEELAAAHRAGRPHRVPPFGTVQNPVRMMMLEHDHAGAVLGRLRAATCDFEAPAAACPSLALLYAELARLERDLHTHMHLEANLLFPRAIALEAAGRTA